LRIAPFWRFPPKLPEILAWLPGFFLPWNAFYALSALAYWAWIIPPVETMQSLAPGWALWLLAVNTIAVALFYGAFEAHLYWRRAQATRFKYNPAFPGDRKSAFFWFGNQNLDNIARTFLFGVTIWTALEVLMLWAFANGYVPWLSFAEHPLYLALLALLVPVIHQTHFYAIHRLIHTDWLYKHVHVVHHKSVNPSPWSSLSMHPVEHLLYFASVIWHLILPSNPVLALYQLHQAGFGAIPGHVGFDRIETGEESSLSAHAYGHYLHHKHFEVNYGDGLVPLDKLFGTYHDGSDAAAEKMRARMKARRAAQR
ncbi:MAG: sterol desaturase family protein, partial [Silicimonas sp.]|nr:sterol desaturase family protein [Silicimonas sp.]